MTTNQRSLIVLALLTGHCLAVGAQPDDQSLADVIGTIAPYVENGEVVGARIGRPGSLFRALGIEHGEVVVQVNGESLTSAQSVLRLITGLAHAQSFELVVRSSTGATRTVRCADRSTGCI